MTQQRYLSIFFQDHDMLLEGALELTQHFLEVSELPDAKEIIAELHEELSNEQRAVRGLMTAHGIMLDPAKSTIAWLGEKVARLKRGGHLLSRSPLSEMTDLENLSMILQASLLFWSALDALGEKAPYVAQVQPAQFIQNIESWRTRIDALYRSAALTTLSHDLDDLPSPS